MHQGPGDTVVGATVNAGGRLVVRAARVGSDTQLAQMALLVENAQTGKAHVQRLADRVAGVFVPVVLGLALVTLIAWLLAGAGAEFAFTAAVAVLIIACPCALGLATPTALLVGTGRAAQLGILIKGPQILESTRRVDTVVLDKTGTVTTGKMSVIDVVADEDGSDADEVLRIAGAIEGSSEHPIAAAIAAAAAQPNSVLPPVIDFLAVPGRGVTGSVEGHTVAVGRRGWLADEFQLTTPAGLEAAAGKPVGWMDTDPDLAASTWPLERVDRERYLRLAPEDRAYVQGLMGRVVEPGKFANWIAPPAMGINRQSVDFDYVRFN